MSNICLKLNNGFKWSNNSGIYVKGYLFDKDGNFYQNDSLISYFENISSDEDLVKCLQNANGIFSVIIKIEQKVYLASDKSRFFPLFYFFNNDELVISDDAFSVLNSGSEFLLNDFASNIFKSTGHTIGRDTLIQNVFQVRAAEYIIFENDKISKSDFFFSYTVNSLYSAGYNVLFHKTKENFIQSFKRFITSLNGKQVALPLSGGYDSRLIAAMLKYFGYENVICFTFGRKLNHEINNSRNAAKALGYKWLFVEYNHEIIKDYFYSEDFKIYAKYAGQITSMPYLQEYFAVKYLKENNIVNDDAIFVPGHSGDILGGSDYIKLFNEDLQRKDITKALFNKKFQLNHFSKKIRNQILHEIQIVVGDYDKNPQDISYTLAEDFNIKERLAKFIFSSSRVFDYFGYEVRFPFWDSELVAFFSKMPFEYKKSKLLYDDVLKKCFFDIYNINFEQELQPDIFEVTFHKIKSKFKFLMPTSFRLKKLIKKDWTFYYEITKPMVKELGLSYKNVKEFNSIIVTWYVEFIKNILRGLF